MTEGVAVDERHGLGIAAVMARKGVAPAAIGAALGLDLPIGPRAAFAHGRTAIGTGPGNWLIVDDAAGEDFDERLARDLSGLASVSDQSGAYLLHRVYGARARTLLQRGMPIDLHPCAFDVGSAATTVVAHVGAIVWQVDASPAYDVAVFRSYAGSFRHWLVQGIAAL